MSPLGFAELESPGDGIEDLLGRVEAPSLLETDVIVDADAGQVGQLLAPQPRYPASTGGRPEPDIFGQESRPPGTEKFPQVLFPVHPFSIDPVADGWNRQGGLSGTRVRSSRQKSKKGGPRVRTLGDVRIVAVEQYGAGPFGSVHLADLGADVPIRNADADAILGYSTGQMADLKSAGAYGNISEPDGSGEGLLPPCAN